MDQAARTKMMLRLEKLLMCSDTERFALLHKLGLGHDFAARQNMSGTPRKVASDLISTLERTNAKDPLNQIIQSYENIPLPAGIPE